MTRDRLPAAHEQTFCLWQRNYMLSQVAALEAADEVDEVAASIGAANTLVRQPDGRLKAYNTDWSAALDAVEAGLGGGARPLAGKRVVVLGAGGTGRAIAFGAQQRGAAVVIANRCGAGLFCRAPGQ